LTHKIPCVHYCHIPLLCRSPPLLEFLMAEAGAKGDYIYAHAQHIHSLELVLLLTFQSVKTFFRLSLSHRCRRSKHSPPSSLFSSAVRGLFRTESTTNARHSKFRCRSPHLLLFLLLSSLCFQLLQHRALTASTKMMMKTEWVEDTL
jgi:hypothetical protein